MYNRFARTEEDLLREQAEFFNSPCADRLVKSVVKATRFSQNSNKNEASSLSSQVVSPNVVEHGLVSNCQAPQMDSPFFGGSSLPFVPILGQAIDDIHLIKAADRLDPNNSTLGKKTRSIFAKQLLAAKERKILTDCEHSKSVLNVPKMVRKLPISLQSLADAGPIAIKGGGLAANEIVRIHENNIDLLSHLSTEDILREKEAIISSADPKVIAFMMHKKHSSIDNRSVTKPCSFYPEKPRADIDFPSPPTTVEVTSQVPHMDVVETEKLAWLNDLPTLDKSTLNSNSPGKSCSARFDLEGRIVPPTADLPTHLGLHHHDEEPQRGGYTINEICQLISSTQPLQRRVALSCLAAALAASRRGHHAEGLQTHSLLHPLLSSAQGGVCFLLRWSLDQAVSEVTRASAPGAGGGISLTVLGECLRALHNLLSDDNGESLLDETFEWTNRTHQTQNHCPSLMKNPHKFSPHSNPGEFNDEKTTSDDGRLMAADPVACLFTKTNLVTRLAWMLSDGPGIRFPPDVVAHWLPGLLLVGVRHSLSLASKIFYTPDLISSLIKHFLPMFWDTSTAVTSVETEGLSVAYGVPLTRVLKLMRVFAQRSPNLRLALVNDWEIIERCLAYLLSEELFGDGVLEHLPAALPVKLRVLLQVESLRCISVMFGDAQAPSKAVDLIRSALPKLLATGECIHRMSYRKPIQRTLWIAWISFFARIIVPRFSKDLTITQVAQIQAWAVDVTDKASEAFCATGDLDLQSINERMQATGLSPTVLAVAFELVSSLSKENTLALREERILCASFWDKLVSHFISYQSVLTGFPCRPSHVNAVELDVHSMYLSADGEESSTASSSWLHREGCVDCEFLTPISVSAAMPCLPDIGMTTCLFHRGDQSGDCRTTPSVWWPPREPSSPVAVVEAIDLIPPRAAKFPSFLPLVAVLARSRCNVDCLLPWCERLVRLVIPPILNKNTAVLPQGLMAIEADLMGQILLKKTQMCASACNTLVWWTAFSLITCLFYGQEALLIEIVKTLLFPPYGLTPVEQSFSLEITSVSAPWPPVHENFATALAHHAHTVYTDYFANILKEPGSGSLNSKVLQCQSCCDFILPDDWFYMPLLECYFHRNRQSAEHAMDHQLSLQNNYSVIATACLGWIRGLLNLIPLKRHTGRRRELSAGAHFTRIVCAILASQDAGGLCFNASGAIIAELLSLVVPLVDFIDLDRRPEAYLPLDVLSLYDLFVELLEHFAAVSYSSAIFANCLLLFLQTALPPAYRRALWGEHQVVLRALSLSPTEIILPTTVFQGLFEPIETDESVLRSYASALCSGLVHPSRQPIAALISIHHLNRVIYSVQATSAHAAFLKQLSYSLKVLSSKTDPRSSQVLSWLRDYKSPVVPVTSDVSVARLSDPSYTSSTACVTELMHLYGTDELPPSRLKRWKAFIE